MMDTWILQGGHPLVRLDAGALTQTHFAFGARAEVTEIGEAWHVPVIARSLDGGGEERHLLGGAAAAVSLDGPVVVNAGGSGYYRVGYDEASLRALTGRLAELDAARARHPGRRHLGPRVRSPGLRGRSSTPS